jgi:Rrf2 family nitric oxide-sensitive transcriptional repressor
MRLTLYTDYSLRVLMYLGTKRDGTATISEIAECYEISKNHLMKVVQQLGQLGYIETLRGKGGGIRLALMPAEINIGEVVLNMEDDLALVQCFKDDEGACRIERACMLRHALQKAQAAFFEVLNRHTLASLLAPKRRLASLLATSTVRVTKAQRPKLGGSARQK